MFQPPFFYKFVSMKLLKTDHFSKIGVLMRAGMITQEDYVALKNKAQKIDL